MSETTCPVCQRAGLTPEEGQRVDLRVFKVALLGFMVGIFIPAAIWAWNFHR